MVDKEGNQTIAVDSPTQRITRSKAALAHGTTPNQNVVNEQSPRDRELRTGHLTSKKSPDSMIKKLSFSSAMPDKKKKAVEAAPDAPSFDLGFDTAIGNEPISYAEVQVSKPVHSRSDKGQVEEPAAQPGHPGCNTVNVEGPSETHPMTASHSHRLLMNIKREL